MRRVNVFLGLLFLLFLFGCNDNAFDEGKNTKVDENIPASVFVDVTSLDNQIQTRATSDANVENALNNLYVFVFNSNGTKSTGKYFDKSSLTGTKLMIDTYSGNAKQIFAVANFELNGMMSLTRKDLDNVKSKDELMSLNAHLMQSIVARGNSFLMSGCIELNGVPANINILPGSNSNSLGVIKLRRVDAKIQFNIEAIAPATFTLREWKVVQLPSNVALFNQTENQFDGSDNFSTEWKKPEGEGALQGKTFSFYALENLRKRKTIISSTDTWAAYALREKNPFNWTREGNKLPVGVSPADKFVFADDRATYVVFSGHIKYMHGADQVEGDVVYTVHLGYFDEVEGNKANDYNIKRNTSYTYNVKIASADRVLVEVEQGSETHPGADGNLTVGGVTLRFDAYNETTMLEFNKDKIDENLTWSVKTSFDEGEASPERKDYNWIFFCLNTKVNNVYQTAFVPFPGLQNLYTGPLDAVNYLKSSNKLINIKQLVSILKSAPKSDQTFYDKNGNVRFTAFIQENFYDETPTVSGTFTGVFEPKLWKKFVNVPERVMNILSENKHSPDGNSARTKVFYSIRQASIQTMYNTDESQINLVKAWGSEMIQDSIFLSFYSGNNAPTVNSSWVSPYTTRDGRKNTFELWSGAIRQNWSTYVDPSTAKMTSSYQIAQYACMQRNRDLNGDNKIDKDELRWYLAALDQLSDLWIGEQSFDQEAYLYKKEMEINGAEFGRKWGEMWYVSSTINKFKSGIKYYLDPAVLWSSEGSSIGQLNETPVKNKLFYRCLRNLGVVSTDYSTAPDPIGAYDSQTGLIELKSLDPNSIREYSQIEELPEHHEREKANLPYQAFFVSKTVSISGLSWTDIRERIRNNNSPCKSKGTGWRVPNQRELSLMRTLIGNDGNWKLENHMSRTRFSMNPAGEYRHGFSVQSNGGILYLINSSSETGGVRCVKDKIK